MSPAPDSQRRPPSLERDPFPTPPVTVAVAARSDRGRQREGNEDALVVAHLGAREAWFSSCQRSLTAPSGQILLAVCDGMGGEAGGEVASRLAALAIERSMRERAPRSADDVEHALVHAVLDASRVVRDAAREPSLTRMGSTATVACVAGRELVVAQVGDSRCYLARDDRLNRLTRDQSLAALMVEQGHVTEEEAENVAGSHVILQAVGSSDPLRVVVTRAIVAPGDLVLLCTDGLTGPVPDRDLAAILARAGDDLDRTCAELVDLANARGGPDNVTCVLARIGA